MTENRVFQFIIAWIEGRVIIPVSGVASRLWGRRKLCALCLVALILAGFYGGKWASFVVPTPPARSLENAIKYRNLASNEALHGIVAPEDAHSTLPVEDLERKLAVPAAEEVNRKGPLPGGVLRFVGMDASPPDSGTIPSQKIDVSEEHVQPRSEPRPLIGVFSN
jgi:hypothetical protein